MTDPIRLLLVSGSLRSGSVIGAALATAVDVAPEGIEPIIYDGLGDLPHFNPDDDVDPLPVTVVALRAAIADAHAVLFCSPEYAGALPGSFKNLLDWTIGGGEIYEKPVGWINAASPGRGELSHESLRTVLTYASTRIIDGATVRITVERSVIESDGLVHDPDIRARIRDVLEVLAHS
jgi:chromate reductase